MDMAKFPLTGTGEEFKPPLWDKINMLEVQKCLGKQECVVKWELSC